MIVFRLRTIFLVIFRLLTILRVMLKHSMREWIGRRRFFRKNIKSKSLNPQDVKNTPERIRMAIEELGPTYIKFGQILADRPDLISEKLRGELKKLQATAKPLPDGDAITLIEHELGVELKEVFSDFQTKHIASASIGQTYVATLLTGERVVIKIQRSNIEQKIRLDIKLMRFLAKQAVKRYPELAIMDVEQVVSEFENVILDELNYQVEASNMMRFADMFKDDPRIKVPKVYHEYTTRRLLIMEFIDGISPDRVDLMAERGIDPKVVAENGADLILNMILKHGFFHADPHPGNIFILPNNVICFIDFGMVGTLKQRHIRFLADFGLGIYKKDPHQLAKALLSLSDRKFFDQMEELEFEMQRILQRYSYLPPERIDLSAVLQECANVLVKYQMHIPSSFFILMKALATIQKFAADLDPNIAIIDLLKNYAFQVIKAKFNIKELATGLYRTLEDYFHLINDLPSEVNEILYKLKQGKLTHEIGIQDRQGVGKVIRKLANRIALALLLGFMLVTSVMLIIWGGPLTALGHTFVWSSMILSFFVALRLFTRIDR